ncbi:MAG: helix-turn-helix domain-containing protein [Rhodospirillales bacterium]|nr:helix-turn-helix domain-containing protein [Rhodospirillales bacterium]
MTSKTPGQVQSISRALGILNLLSQHDDGLNLTSIGKSLSLAPSTAHRLLTTLQNERYVRFNDAKCLWQIGVQAFVVGSHFLRSRELIAVAQPHLEELMELSAETANLAMANRGEVVYLAQVECRQLMRTLAKPGSRVAMHCSAVGKALLAQLSAQEVTQMLHTSGLPRVTERTITSIDRLIDDLKLVKKNGYALDDEEHALGLRCIAAPVFDEHGKTRAAVSLSGPKIRIPEDRIGELAQMVMNTGHQITEQYGGMMR